jgi:hypothetical protein
MRDEFQHSVTRLLDGEEAAVVNQALLTIAEYCVAQTKKGQRNVKAAPAKTEARRRAATRARKRAATKSDARAAGR